MRPSLFAAAADLGCKFCGVSVTGTPEAGDDEAEVGASGVNEGKEGLAGVLEDPAGAATVLDVGGG